MANVKISFLDFQDESEIQVYNNQDDEIYIAINPSDFGHSYNAAWISLDVDTAVKFAKELRRQIAISKHNISYKSNEDEQ